MQPTKEIWLVRGSTGEYSDHCEWLVMAYPSEVEAQKHADAAQAFMAGKTSPRFPTDNPYDPQCQCYYTGTDYAVEMVEVRETFPPHETES